MVPAPVDKVLLLPIAIEPSAIHVRWPGDRADGQ
jgi:hypothetical protein